MEGAVNATGTAAFETSEALTSMTHLSKLIRIQGRWPEMKLEKQRKAGSGEWCVAF